MLVGEEGKEYDSVEVLSCGVVVVSLSAELNRSGQVPAHDLIGLVVGNIELEEARVGLWESIFVHTCHEAHLVPVTEVGAVDGDTAATPDEAEV